MFLMGFKTIAFVFHVINEKTNTYDSLSLIKATLE